MTRLIVVFGLCLIMGCATAASPSKVVVPPDYQHIAQAPPSTDPDDGLKVEGTVGEMDADDVQEVLEHKMPLLEDCFAKAQAEHWYIFGKLSLHFQVRRDGAVKRVQLINSDVGDDGVEYCVEQVAQSFHFVAPKGGEGEVTVPLSFGHHGHKSIESWGATQVRRVLMAHAREVKTCSHELVAGLTVTGYIDQSGTLQALGVSAPTAVPSGLAH